ncbi:hypothetical protein FBEOM_4207 [Fusarium beomiforme]|uniref:Uncharacterized protein n=1 Tax=Fusarium beomiforme TaxID=44412 RepID=A0A9P5E060_9HYPO|nr:hypothetical protein FBEOM_4207 [Fusarium beomiforme]
MVQETIEPMLELRQEDGGAVLKKKAQVVKTLARIEVDTTKHTGLYGGTGVASRRSISDPSLEVVVSTIGAINTLKMAMRQQLDQSPSMSGRDKTAGRTQSSSAVEFHINNQMTELPGMSEQDFLQLDSLDGCGLSDGDESDLNRKTTFSTINQDLEIGDWRQNW